MDFSIVGDIPPDRAYVLLDVIVKCTVHRFEVFVGHHMFERCSDNSLGPDLDHLADSRLSAEVSTEAERGYHRRTSATQIPSPNALPKSSLLIIFVK